MLATPSLGARLVTKPLFLLGEAWGENEARIGRPFVGASGIELLRMLDEAGILELTSEDSVYMRRFWSEGKPELLDCIWNMHPEIYRSNVFNQRPPGNKLEWFCGPRKEGIVGYPALVGSKYVRREFIPELERLADEIINVDPNLILALGNSALWALGGKTGVSKLRGTTCLSTHTASGFKLLPTYHPSAVLRQWENRPVAVMDLIKARREAEYPDIRRPKREIWIEPSLEDCYAFKERYINGCTMLSVDIETAGNQVTCIGFAPSNQVALVVPLFDARRKGKCYWPNASAEQSAWVFIRSMLESPRPHKVFQNGMYDIAFLWRACGIKVAEAEHDTMLLSHSQQPESLKSLAFLGSCFADEGAWKAEHKAGTLKRDA